MSAARPVTQRVVGTLVSTDLANHGHFSWQNLGEQVVGQLLGQAVVDGAVVADAQRTPSGRAIRLDPIAPFVAPQMGTMVEASPVLAQSTQPATANPSYDDVDLTGYTKTTDGHLVTPEGRVLRLGRADLLGGYTNVNGDHVFDGVDGRPASGMIVGSKYPLTDLPSDFQSKYGVVHAAWDGEGQG
jgi:hypothetical protein